MTKPETDHMLGRIQTFLSRQHPYDHLSQTMRAQIADRIDVLDLPADHDVYSVGNKLRGLYVIEHGTVIVFDDTGQELSHLSGGNSFGERGLLKDGRAVTSARTLEPTKLFLIPADLFATLMADHDPVRRFFDRGDIARDRSTTRAGELTTTRVDDLMVRDPKTCPSDTTLQAAAQIMRDTRISSLFVADGDDLKGIVTVRDMSNRAIAGGLPIDTTVDQIMTRDLITLPSSAIGSDVLHLMMERHMGHLPVVDGTKLIGVVTQTDLMRFMASTSAGMMADMRRAKTPADLAKITANIPDLLVQLVGAGNRHEVVTRLITDVADGVTRRLIALAQDQFGPAPVPFCWAACGSQGRQEQTGVSDQDNCLIIDNAASPRDMDYFAKFAQFVCDGLNVAGYVYCPGDMMATNLRWCARQSTWQGYFDDWIARPSKEAQMLASVMFDLRVIDGDETLFTPLQTDVLKATSRNSFFTAHMATNAVGHVPPLGLIRSFATVRSGEHRNHIDMKSNGVVPIVDLGRMYALQGKITVANTRARIQAAPDRGAVSPSGARDLLDAYDMIAQTRLENQAAQIKAGEKPDNYMAPSGLSDFERSHLRDAFVVVKTMQSALMQGRGVLG
ncbi:DUF294 nucleotidyltransferase-like domain-containing protein [Aestuariibius sp. HNIBRBA575]|uniref:DUF294 nucleotidyltransferase-like domain-containing protein n=1 Tax=Aestuariibius sp. HNIBRBA575 TaxID=3233343 RepID=UPI0034A5152F